MKFFVDNNISPKAARALHALVEPKHEVVHLKEKFPPDVADVVWMKSLGSETDWIILSGDTNIQRNPHEIKAWQEAGHTSFFLASGWMHLSRFEQASKLMHIFERVVELAEKAKRGTCYLIPVRGAKIENMSE